MTITERIFVALAQKKLSQKEFAKRIEVNEKTVSAWKKNNSLPPVDKISKISDCLGVTIDYLLTGKENQQKELNDDEQELLENYNKLTDEEKKEISQKAEELATQNHTSLKQEIVVSKTSDNYESRMLKSFRILSSEAKLELTIRAEVMAEISKAEESVG